MLTEEKKNQNKTNHTSTNFTCILTVKYVWCMGYFFFIYFDFINETLNTSDCKATSTQNRLVKKSILPGNTHVLRLCLCECMCVNMPVYVCVSVCVCGSTKAIVTVCVCISLKKNVQSVCIHFALFKTAKIIWTEFISLQCIVCIGHFTHSHYNYNTFKTSEIIRVHFSYTYFPLANSIDFVCKAKKTPPPRLIKLTLAPWLMAIDSEKRNASVWNSSILELIGVTDFHRIVNPCQAKQPRANKRKKTHTDFFLFFLMKINREQIWRSKIPCVRDI